MVEKIEEKKSIYFVILIVILIILAIMLTIHFNNKEFVDLKEYDIQTTKKVKKDVVTTTLTSKALKITERAKYLKKTSIEDVYTTYSESDINTNLVVSFLSNKKLNLNVKKYDLDDSLKAKNIISLYDIDLYDNDKIVDVHDNNVTIKIPFNSDNYEYDYYKIAYLNDTNDILEYIDPTLNDGYIIFNTTHLSRYAIVGFKNEIDLTKTTVNLYKNNLIISDYNKILKLSKDDLLDVLVSTDYKDYKVEYSLRNNISTNYQSFDKSLLNKINDTQEYTLIIKVIVGDKEKVFESIKFRVFDIIVNNETIDNIKKDAVVNSESNFVIGETNIEESSTEPITSSPYHYDDREKNKDILIDISQESDISDDNNSDKPNENDKVVIEVKGNMYVLDETDLSNLYLTGFLTIETSENVIFNETENKIDTTDLNCIEINVDSLTNKIFTINGIQYSFEIDENNVVTIKKVDDIVLENNYNDLFGNLSNISYNENKLIFSQKEKDE